MCRVIGEEGLPNTFIIQQIYDPIKCDLSLRLLALES